MDALTVPLMGAILRRATNCIILTRGRLPLDFSGSSVKNAGQVQVYARADDYLVRKH